MVVAGGTGAALLLLGGQDPAGPPEFLAADVAAIDDDVLLGSISPDGRHVLEADLREPNQICVRAVRDPQPSLCSALLEYPSIRAATWSADGNRVLVSDDVARLFRGGDVLLLDVAEDRAVLVGDTVPIDRDGGDGSFRVLLATALSPDGTQFAGQVFTETTESNSPIVLHDLDTGEEETFDVGERIVDSMIWAPDGAAVWLNEFNFSDRGGELTRLDIASGELRSIGGSIDLGDEFDRERVRLVQISDDERVGLLAADELLLRYGVRANMPYLALIDLETGVRAPLLPVGPDDPEQVEHALLTMGRLRANGEEVLFAYHTEQLPQRGDLGPSPVRLAWLPTAAILDGADGDEVIVVDDLGGYVTVDDPVLAATGLHLDLSLLPEGEEGLVLPFGTGGLIEAETLLVVELDRRF